MPTTPSVAGGFDPNQAVGLQRTSAFNRVQQFENMMHRRLGMLRPQRYTRFFNYYSAQNLPPDNVEQPLAINYYRAVCDKHTSYLWGTWQDDIINWRVKPRAKDIPEDGTSKTIRQWLDDLFDANDKNSLLWDASHNGSVYGDSILRLRWDAYQRRVVIESLLPEWFHCRWDVNNMNRLTEVIISYPMDRLDAEEQFGTSGHPSIDYNLINPEYLPGMAVYWEHWTPTSYRRWIGDYLIAQAPNPFMMTDDEENIYPGIIPFVHVPNLRVGGEFWGFSDGENMLFLQDEINRRMADMGDTVNNFAHPIVTINGMYGQQADLPVGPDAVWDLGREGKAQILQWSGSPPAVLEYITLLKDMMHDTTNLPDVAFGRSMRGSGSGGSGGKGASGAALQMAMNPPVERAMQKRIYWTIGLKQAADMAAFINWVKDPATLPFKYPDMKKYEVGPTFAPILPRDRLQIVNEVVARVNSFTQSTASALEMLGEDDISAEQARIQADARFKAKLGLLAMPKPGGKNSDRGNGGSSSQQNGPGSSSRKPGSSAKEA